MRYKRPSRRSFILLPPLFLLPLAVTAFSDVRLSGFGIGLPDQAGWLPVWRHLQAAGGPKHLLAPLLEQLLFGVPLLVPLLLFRIPESSVLLEPGIRIELRVVRS